MFQDIVTNLILTILSFNKLYDAAIHSFFAFSFHSSKYEEDEEIKEYIIRVERTTVPVLLGLVSFNSVKSLLS